MTRNSKIFELVAELLFANSVIAEPVEPPTSKILIFSFALSYTTSLKMSEYVGITATSVDILPSLRSADTPPVAYASEAPKVIVA